MTNAEQLTPGLRTLLESAPAGESITTSDVTFASGDVTLKGFLARPEAQSVPLPAVLVISDWTGLNDHARVRAQLLAKLGYVALAGDVYGDGAEIPQDQAGATAGKFYADPALFRERMKANFDQLAGTEGVAPDRIGAIGFCFGGAAALELARSGVEAAGVVSFHGGLKTAARAEAGSIRTPILVLTGAADPVVPDSDVLDLENELRAAEAPDWQVVSYSGAMHAFMMPDANAPQHGATFDASTAARAWTAMRSFFDEVLAPKA